VRPVVVQPDAVIVPSSELARVLACANVTTTCACIRCALLVTITDPYGHARGRAYGVAVWQIGDTDNLERTTTTMEGYYASSFVS
jgi:hypothetical protein